MARGGKRPRAGRPRGPTRTQHPPSRELTLVREVLQEQVKIRAAKAASAGKGKLALEVLRENMMWGQAVANLMMGQCEQALQEGAIPAALDWLNEASKMWWFAHKCAKAILPYETSKLAAIAPASPHERSSKGQEFRRTGSDGRLSGTGDVRRTPPGTVGCDCGGFTRSRLGRRRASRR